MTRRKVTQIINCAKEVLKIEAEGLLGLIDKLDDNFARAVETILQAEGRVIVTGVGKSGIVGRKIVATLNSTGTPALFLHPVEAMHGDLGMVTSKDVILAISNSGETGEITILIPSFKRLKAPLIAFTGNPQSTLAKHSDMVIDTGVKREACPLGLAPTASTTATLAMGDALAVVLLEERKFSPEDFRRFHPGGTLGKRLAPKVIEMMRAKDKLICVTPQTPLKRLAKYLSAPDIIWVVKYKRLCGLIDAKAKLEILSKADLKGKVADKMVATKESVSEGQSIADVLKLMQDKGLEVVPVVNSKGHFKGAVFLKDLLPKINVSFQG